MIDLITISDLMEGPVSLAKGPSTTDVVCLHLSRALYNSSKGSTILAEYPLNYKPETENPGYRLVPVESP